MFPQPVSKLPDVGTTIFSVMSALASEHGAINLSQGFPDFEPPPLLRERVTANIRAGRNQYAPMHGVAELRERIAEQMGARYNVDLNPDNEITVTSGATEALFSTIAALAGPGDDVIVLDPAYDSYDPAIRLAGARCVHVGLDPHDFSIDFVALRAALSERTRMIVINTPHNPTGAVIGAESLRELADAIRDVQCYVLSDEVYEHIVTGATPHASVVSIPELRERSVAVFSFGKTYHATGWKIGYAVAPAALTAEIRRVHQFNTFATATPLQYAIADFMAAEPDFPASIGGFYRAKRDCFRGLLEHSRFTLQPSDGTYFQLVDYSAISDLGDVEFARWLTTDVGVAAIPVSVFCAGAFPRRLVRLCFAKQDDTLSSAAERLCRI